MDNSVVDRALRAIIDADDCRETIKAAAADAAELAESWPIPVERVAVAARIAGRAVRGAGRGGRLAPAARR